jgi:hypothetical protein
MQERGPGLAAVPTTIYNFEAPGPGTTLDDDNH